MMKRVIRRHRLPHPYRVGLTVLWITPLLMFIVVIVAERGVDPALLDPRFLLPALLMIAPAFYFWREGVDVLPEGIYRRIHLPRFYAYSEMRRWDFNPQRVLTIWDAENGKILECRAEHLTDFAALLEVVQERVGG